MAALRRRRRVEREVGAAWMHTFSLPLRGHAACAVPWGARGEPLDRTRDGGRVLTRWARAAPWCDSMCSVSWRKESPVAADPEISVRVWIIIVARLISGPLQHEVASTCLCEIFLSLLHKEPSSSLSLLSRSLSLHVPHDFIESRNIEPFALAIQPSSLSRDKSCEAAGSLGYVPRTPPVIRQGHWHLEPHRSRETALIFGRTRC